MAPVPPSGAKESSWKLGALLRCSCRVLVCRVMWSCFECDARLFGEKTVGQLSSLSSSVPYIFVYFCPLYLCSKSLQKLLTTPYVILIKSWALQVEHVPLHPFTALLSTVGTVFFRRVKTISSSDPVVVNKQTTIRRSFLRHLGFLWRAHLKLQDIG